ncbi:MAG: MarR family transcriptional regulator [Gemmatimonadota bacterium]
MTDESATPSTSQLQAEIGQTRPFGSAAQEALLGISHTASILDRVITRALAPSKISPAQYNVLRILRGAGGAGLPTLAIRCRMIDPSAAITRLVDKLEEAGLASRSRASDDRREVRCRITPEGLALLAELDPIMARIEGEVGHELPAAELKALIHALDQIRNALE